MRGKHHPFFVAFLMLSVYFLCASVEPAIAKLYKWKDDKGSTHYTDNENNIPLQYRNKDKIEKLKGLSEAKPPAEDPSDETPAEETIAEGEESVPEGEEEGPSEADAEALLFLQELKAYLDTEIRLKGRILQAVPPNVKYGKHYILPVQARAELKFSMAQKIKDSGIESLKPVSQFLITSGQLDSELGIGGDGYLQRILDLRDRIESEIETKKNLVKKVEDEIAKIK